MRAKFDIVMSPEQGGRSCAKAQRAFAEKAWLDQKFLALAYGILSQY